MKKLLLLLALFTGRQALAQEASATTGGTKKNAVRIFPNPSANGNFYIHSNERTSLALYVFDVNGTLVYQTVLKEKGKHTIENLNKGVYIYDVFKNDEGIEHGRLLVK